MFFFTKLNCKLPWGLIHIKEWDEYLNVFKYKSAIMTFGIQITPSSKVSWIIFFSEPIVRFSDYLFGQLIYLIWGSHSAHAASRIVCTIYTITSFIFSWKKNHFLHWFIWITTFLRINFWCFQINLNLFYPGPPSLPSYTAFSLPFSQCCCFNCITYSSYQERISLWKIFWDPVSVSPNTLSFPNVPSAHNPYDTLLFKLIFLLGTVLIYLFQNLIRPCFPCIFFPNSFFQPNVIIVFITWIVGSLRDFSTMV